MSKLTGECNNHFPSIAVPGKSLILYVCEFSMMNSIMRLVVTANIGRLFVVFRDLDREFNGAGRIRTSDLQRPRLASCQTRQRPQRFTFLYVSMFHIIKCW